MGGITLLQDFAIILLVAAAAGWLFRKMGLSAVVGYLLAGVIIGPYTPPFQLVSDVGRIQALSELGLVFLMFFVGLGLSLRRIQRMGFPILLATAITATGVYLLAQLFARWMGWDALTGQIFAAMFMASSSAIITKMMGELRLTHERFGQNAQGVTVLEDVVAVVMLTIIGSQLRMTGGTGAPASQNVGATVFLLLGFAVMVVVLGLIFVPRLLSRVSQSSDADLKAMLVAGLVFMAGVISVNAGFSVALGAFLFGVVVAETRFKVSVEKRLSGAQDMFSSIFFVSIGMLIDVGSFAEHWRLILLVAAFAIVARILASTFGLLVAGSSIGVAASSAIVLTPIGEFSYIIAQLGVGAKVVPDSFYAIAVGTSIITAVLCPLFARFAERAGLGLEKVTPAPLRKLVESYRVFLDHVGSQAAKIQVWQLTKRRVGLTLLEVFLLAGLFGFANPLLAGIDAGLDRAGYDFPFLRGVYWGIVLILGTSLIVAIWRSMHALCMIYAEVLTLRDTGVRSRRKTVQIGLQVAGTLALALLVIGTFPIRTTDPWLAVLLLVAPALIIGFGWRRLILLHSQFEISLADALEKAGTSRMAHVATGLRQRDWGLDVADITLPDFAACSGKSIQELAIRRTYGCSVLEINRQGFLISNPRPEIPLFSGDQLLLFGSEEQINRARPFLTQEATLKELQDMDFTDNVLDTVTVPLGSRAAGGTLAELKVAQKTGVQVVGIERDRQRILNPSGKEQLLVGDLVLIIANRNEVRAMEDLLAPYSPGIGFDLVPLRGWNE